MRRLHIRIDLPPHTEAALRNAYAPANDATWMIPFEDDTTVEQLAHIIQARYRSRYPEFANEASLRLRKISDGYGMVPDRSSRVGDIWEARQVGLPAEEYTVHATRGELVEKEIAFLNTRLARGREFSLAPESSARIPKRGLTGRRGSVGAYSALQSNHSSKRRRLDRGPPSVVDLSQPASSMDAAGYTRPLATASTGLSRPLTPIAVEDSQLSAQSHWNDVTAEREATPKSESQEPTAEQVHSVPLSQLDTPAETSERVESIAVTDLTTLHEDLHAASGHVQHDEGQPELHESVDGTRSSPEPQAATVQPQDIFDVPRDDPEEQARSTSGSLSTSRTSSAADLLAVNRKRNRGVNRTPTGDNATSERLAADKKRSPAFLTPICPQPDSDIEDDDGHQVARRSTSVTRRLGRTRSPEAGEESTSSKNDGLETLATETAAAVPDQVQNGEEVEMNGANGQAQSNSESPEESAPFTNEPGTPDVSEPEDSRTRPVSFVTERAAAKKAREANSRLYSQMQEQDAEFSDMLSFGSPVKPQALTPMIPGSKLKPALKIPASKASDGESSVSQPPSDSKKPESGMRRSVSFTDMPQIVQDANTVGQDDARRKSSPNSAAPVVTTYGKGSKGIARSKNVGTNASNLSATASVTPKTPARPTNVKAESETSRMMFYNSLFKSAGLTPATESSSPAPVAPASTPSERAKGPASTRAATPLQRPKKVSGAATTTQRRLQQRTSKKTKSPSSSPSPEPHVYQPSPRGDQVVAVVGADIRYAGTSSARNASPVQEGTEREASKAPFSQRTSTPKLDRTVFQRKATLAGPGPTIAPQISDIKMATPVPEIRVAPMYNSQTRETLHATARQSPVPVHQRQSSSANHPRQSPAPALAKQSPVQVADRHFHAPPQAKQSPARNQSAWTSTSALSSAESVSLSAGSESRSPARQVESSSDDETESESESDSDSAAEQPAISKPAHQSPNAAKHVAANSLSPAATKLSATSPSAAKPSATAKALSESSSDMSSDSSDEENSSSDEENSSSDEENSSSDNPALATPATPQRRDLRGIKPQRSSDDDAGKQLLAESSQSQGALPAAEAAPRAGVLNRVKSSPTPQIKSSPHSSQTGLPPPPLIGRPSFNAIRERSMQESAAKRLPPYRNQGPAKGLPGSLAEPAKSRVSSESEDGTSDSDDDDDDESGSDGEKKQGTAAKDRAGFWEGVAGSEFWRARGWENWLTVISEVWKSRTG